MGARSKQSRPLEKQRKEIGARLRYLREARGYSLQKIADSLRPPTRYSTVQKWEYGWTEIPLDRLKELCSIYNVASTDVLSF